MDLGICVLHLFIQQARLELCRGFVRDKLVNGLNSEVMDSASFTPGRDARTGSLVRLSAEGLLVSCGSLCSFRTLASWWVDPGQVSTHSFFKHLETHALVMGPGICFLTVCSTRPEEPSPCIVVYFEVVQFRGSVFDWNLFKFMQLSGVKPVATSFQDGSF